MLPGMARALPRFKPALAAGFLLVATSWLPAAADEVDDALAALSEAESGHEQIAERARKAWSRSGSDAMDYLLRRGREAIEAEDWPSAIDHLTALTDHAPDFAEGYNARAVAFFRAGMTGQALADIERTLALEPRNFDAMAGLGFVMLELGDEEAALFAFHEAAGLNPGMEEVNQAIEDLEKATGGSAL